MIAAFPSSNSHRGVVADPPSRCCGGTRLDALQAESQALKRPQAEAATELDALLPDILDCAFNGEP